MNKIRYFAVALLVTIIGCSCDVEHVYGADVIIENRSTRSITLDNSVTTHVSSDLENIHTTIAPGENYSFKRSSDVTILDPAYYIGNKCLVKFGDDVSVVHNMQWGDDIAIEHSICEDSSFELLKQSKYTTKFSYTFTDADYDRAVEWNATHGE